MTRQYLSCADTAKLVRAALKESFPGIKFSVRSDTYSMGATVYVRWTDGPTTAMVDSVVGIFEGSYFDGMTDYKGSRYALMDGVSVRFGADYVSTARELSDAAIAKAIARVQRMNVADDEARAVINAATVAEFNKGAYSYVRLWNGSVQDLIRQTAYKMSFYLTPRKSKTAGRVIYCGNDGHSDIGALNVA